MSSEFNVKRTLVSLAAGSMTGICIMIALKGDASKLKVWRYFRKQVKHTNDPKLAIVVRDDLPMTYGKQLAQISHAGLNCYLQTKASDPELLRQWESLSRPTVVAKTILMGEMKFKQLQQTAKKYNVLVEPIRDAGHTQVSAGTLTALGIGPADGQLISKICGEEAAFK